MYYLTYRPKILDEIDNAKAREALSKLLSSQSLPHAFLFIGQKGTGKTSSARILAKAVNCLNNRFADPKYTLIDPCNGCSNCKSIDASSSPDVFELDAASNRGINEVKSLIREAAFSPMNGRKRVFIIDEAHMITTDGFNALLKTLEEPPSSVLFILATTNEEKIPKTISSRCLIINFGKAKKEEIIRQLTRIAKAEKLTMDDNLLALIASHCEHSFRDGAKMLEELVTQNKLQLDTAKQYLGIRAKGSLLPVIERNSLKDALGWIEEFHANGGNIKMAVEELLEELRILLLQKSGVVGDESVPSTLTLMHVVKLIKLLTESYSLLKISPIDSLPLEIAVVEFYNVRNK